MSRGKAGFSLCCSLAFVILACSDPNPPPPDLTKLEARASYGVGLQMGRNFQRQDFPVDVDLMQRGIRDGLAGAEPLLTDAEIEAALHTARAEAWRVLGEKNQHDGKAFLAENGKRNGITTLSSGLQYEILRQGHGRSPNWEDLVVVHYRGLLLDGTEFDDTRANGRPETVRLKEMIPGWVEALQRMAVGSRWRIWVPPELAHGEKGSPPEIGPEATLVFEIELIDIARTATPGTSDQG